MRSSFKWLLLASSFFVSLRPGPGYVVDWRPKELEEAEILVDNQCEESWEGGGGVPGSASAESGPSRDRKSAEGRSGPRGLRGFWERVKTVFEPACPKPQTQPTGRKATTGREPSSSAAEGVLLARFEESLPSSAEAPAAPTAPGPRASTKAKTVVPFAEGSLYLGRGRTKGQLNSTIPKVYGTPYQRELQFEWSDDEDNYPSKTVNFDEVVFENSWANTVSTYEDLFQICLDNTTYRHEVYPYPPMYPQGSLNESYLWDFVSPQSTPSAGGAQEACIPQTYAGSRKKSNFLFDSGLSNYLFQPTPPDIESIVTDRAVAFTVPTVETLADKPTGDPEPTPVPEVESLFPYDEEYPDENEYTFDTYAQEKSKQLEENQRDFIPVRCRGNESFVLQRGDFSHGCSVPKLGSWGFSTVPPPFRFHLGLKPFEYYGFHYRIEDAPPALKCMRKTKRPGKGFEVNVAADVPSDYLLDSYERMKWEGSLRGRASLDEEFNRFLRSFFLGTELMSSEDERLRQTIQTKKDTLKAKAKDIGARYEALRKELKSLVALEKDFVELAVRLKEDYDGLSELAKDLESRQAELAERKERMEGISWMRGERARRLQVFKLFLSHREGV